MSRTKKNQDENGIKAPPENENSHLSDEQPYEGVKAAADDTVKNEARVADADELKDVEINRLASELESLKDLMQRRQADFENFKKRSLRQQEEFKKFALRDMALDIITINDDLIRAVESSVNLTENCESTFRSFAEGVDMISKRIEGALEKYGIVQIDTEGAVFDPNFHEAVEIETVAGLEQDMVAKVYQKGFKLEDMVIRSSKVKVAKAGKPLRPDDALVIPPGNETEASGSGLEGT